MSAQESPGTRTRHAVLSTVLGDLTVVARAFAPGEAITGIYFPGHWTKPDRTAFGERSDPEEPIFALVATQLAEYFGRQRTTFEIPLAPRGSAFAERVWELLSALPYGSTTTYGELGRRVGTGNFQLVGQAVGHNPISIIVPCHRVVGSDGKLTGYAGGLERKAYLLELEGIGEPSLFGGPG